MSQDKDGISKGIIQSSVIDAAVQLVILKLCIEGFAGVVFSGALTRLLGNASENYTARQKSALKEFLLELLYDETRTPQNVAEEFEKAASTENGGEAVAHSFKAVWDVPDADVVPVIARLTKLYVTPNQRVDSFFRSMLRMLSDCDYVGVEDLRKTVASAKGATGFYARTFFSAIQPESVEPIAPVAPGDPEAQKVVTHRKPAPLTFYDGSNTKVPVTTSTGGVTRINHRDPATEGAGKSPKDIEGIPYERAMQVVQRLGVVGVGMPRPAVGAEGVAVTKVVMERLEKVLGAPKSSV